MLCPLYKGAGKEAGMRFKDRVAIITGGTAGMGRAAALGFAREGASVVINGRNEEKLQKTADEIRSAGGTVTAVRGDITVSDCIKAIVATALAQYGRIDILFNYVGGDPDLAPLTPFIEQTEDFWDRMIDLNLRSTIIMSRAVLDSMIKQKYGKIINTAAIAGRVGGPRMAVYSAVKGGVIAFTKALALEVAPYNINVNCVSPGPIDTPGFNKVFTGDAREHAADIVPLGRVGLPEEVASAVLYLASDDAAFITGQTLAVDGGATMV
jgi:NAD(P)-dependent dehydrogenase (short-subunit alcohol dehydrogenase family)